MNIIENANEVISDLNSKIDQMKKKLEDLNEKLLHRGEDVIIEHCDELRRLSQLAAEEAIQRIQNLNDELIAQINQFQTDKLSQYNLNKNKNEHLLNDLSLLKQQCEQLDNRMVSMSDQCEPDELEIKLNEIDFRIQTKEEDLKWFMFNYDSLSFQVKSIPHFGQLKPQKNSVIDIDDLESIKLDFDKEITHTRTCILDNDYFVISFISESNLYIIVFDDQMNEKIRKLIDENVDSSYVLVECGNKIAINYSYLSQYRDLNKIDRIQLKLYDNGLNEIKSARITSSGRLIGMGNEHVFFKDLKDLHVFNHEMQQVKVINIASIMDSRYDYVLRLYEFNQKWYLIYHSNHEHVLKFVNRSNLDDISFDVDYMKLDPSRIIKTERYIETTNSMEFNFYNLNGVLLKSVSLKLNGDFQNLSYFSFKKNLNIVYFNEAESTISFSKRLIYFHY